MSLSSITAEAGESAYGARVNYTEQKARRYQSRRETKHRAELRLVERAFHLIPPGRVLDAPCGGGRISVLLAGRDYQMTAADLSEPMLAIARENFRDAGLEVVAEHQDIERFTYEDRRFDSVICFRVFHHLPTTDLRRRVVGELCRVADRFVALSYFSPCSVTSIKRRIRAALGLGKLRHHQTPLREVRGYFENSGFRLVKDFAQFPFWHTLHLAVFERRGDGSSLGPKNRSRAALSPVPDRR